jgi:hypothetical protein
MAAYFAGRGWVRKGRIFLHLNSATRLRCRFGGEKMHILAVLLIGLGAVFNCGAIGFLLLDHRKRGLNHRSFQESLDEIDRQLARARRERGEF